MRTRWALFALGVAVAGLGGRLAAQEAGRTIWDGVYTEAQAERGAAVYTEQCAMCHGPQLAGTGEAKPLTGPEFLANWNGLSLGELYDRTRTTMPQQAPGELTRDQYADVLAYLLKFNGYPAGQKELDKRSEVLAGIRFEAYKAAAGGAADAADTAPLPNPYKADAAFLKLPAGRTMGSTSSVAVDSRGHIWVVDRCGANNCAGSDLAPVMEFDAKGRFVQAFGAGMFNFPHGLTIDSKDRLWVVDNRAQGGKGAQVFAFDRTGKVLMTLGKAGVSGDGTDVFNEPNAVAVARDGTIFVADGHSAGKGAHRIMKFAADGRFLKQWGSRGSGPDQLEVPHALALDAAGRLYVGDRWNNRVQVFDTDGKLLASWDQFGRPSGVYVDARGALYVSDSESREPEGYGHHPGWRRGVRIGDARTGEVRAFIPDLEPNPDKLATSGAEGLAVGADGALYGAQVNEKAVVRYTR